VAQIILFKKEEIHSNWPTRKNDKNIEKVQQFVHTYQRMTPDLEMVKETVKC
jgi:hypothetical protein